MKPVLLVFSWALLIVGCKNSDKLPGNILPQPKMQAVLWDMMRADQFLSDYVLNKDSSKNKELESIQLYKKVFAFHKISKEEFEKSFEYYRSRPQLLQVLMDSISKQKTSTSIKLVSAEEDTAKKPAMVETAIETTAPNIDSIKKVMAPHTVPFFQKDSVLLRRKKIIPVKGD